MARKDDGKWPALGVKGTATGDTSKASKGAPLVQKSTAAKYIG
jgi:hypothetical protein